MPEIIKQVIHTDMVMPIYGFDLMVHSTLSKKSKKPKNTLVKKSFQITPNGKKYGQYKGMNLNDLLLIKKNWNKILGAMVK